MLVDRVESAWIDAFVRVFRLCAMRPDEGIVVLAETQSRPVSLQLAELALGQLRLPHYRITVPTPGQPEGPVVRSSGASQALNGHPGAAAALAAADVVVDLTLEGLMHSPQTSAILKTGTRIMTVSNEHPEALARLVPGPEARERGREAVARCRTARTMTVRSDSGTDLDVGMVDAVTVGVWGWTDRPGTLAHWPGGVVVSFPPADGVNGRLVYRPGDINLTFKRYFESVVELVIVNDYVTEVVGKGLDAALMREYFAGFGEKDTYATSHVGWGFNSAARYEALTMYDRRDTNCTELRTLAGNFLFSTGANEFAGRFTRGHFDLPMMGCDIALDGTLVVEDGRLV